MKNNQNRIILGIIVILVIVIGVTAYLSKDQLATKKQLNNDAIFSIVFNDEEIASYNMQEIQALGEVDFYANLKSSGNDPIEYQYSGVLLKNILGDVGIDVTTIESAVVYAIDGYAVSLSLDKLLDDDNVYLAYMQEGELIGTREEGGQGPYQMIIRKDQFSQYWCKYAYSIELR